MSAHRSANTATQSPILGRRQTFVASDIQSHLGPYPLSPFPTRTVTSMATIGQTTPPPPLLTPPAEAFVQQWIEKGLYTTGLRVNRSCVCNSTYIRCLIHSYAHNTRAKRCARESVVLCVYVVSYVIPPCSCHLSLRHSPLLKMNCLGGSELLHPNRHITIWF